MPVYTNNNPLKYTIISFYEEMDVVFSLKGAGGGGGGHPDDVRKDFRGGNGAAGGIAYGTVRVRAGDVWSVYVGGGGKRGLSWYLGGDGGPGGSSLAGFHGGAGGRQGSLGKSSGGGGGGGASVITYNGAPGVVANGGAGGGGEGQFGSGFDAATTPSTSNTANFGGPGATSLGDGGGGGGGGGGTPGGLGGAFGEGDTGGRAGSTGRSFTSLTGVTVSQTGGSAGGIGGSGDFTNNTDGADGYFEIVEFVLPEHRHTGIYTKDSGTWKQPVPNVKYNGNWTQIQEGYVKHNDKWVRVYPPKVSVEINDYSVLEASAGNAVPWNNTVTLVVVDDTPPTLPDDLPAQFSFESKFDQEVSTLVESNTITITGINVAVPVTVSQGQFSINGGAWVSSGNISNGQTLRLRTTSSANFQATQTVSVKVGAGTGTWTVTTKSQPIPTYKITPSTLNVREGDSVTFTIETTNLANGTVLYWKDTGNTVLADFADGLKNGSITVQNNTAVLGRTVKRDVGVAKPAEYIIIQLSLTNGGAVVVTAPRVDITDTSVTTPTYPARGTLLSTYCQGVDKWGVYADGSGGSYNQLIQSNSADCGWVDDTPNSVTFTSLIGLNLSTATESNTVTISGVSTSVPVTLSSGLSASKNGGAWQTSGISVTNSDTLKLRATTSAAYKRADSYVITIGKFSTTWSLTTKNGPVPTVSNINWSGPFNSDNARLRFNLATNATNGPITSARIIGQPTKGTVSIGEDGVTAFYTPTHNGVQPGTLSASQAQTYVNYWTDLFPNGIKSVALAQQHWVNQGLPIESRYVPTVASISDSFTFRVTNQYGESTTASVLIQLTPPTNLPLDATPPTVISVLPSSGATGISVSSGLSITYSEAIYPGTGTITMVDQFGTAAGSWTNASATLSGPIVSLASGTKKSNTTYTVSVPAGFVKDAAGNPSEAYSWSFTTSDAERPYVIGVDVVNGQVTLVWNENITVVNGAYGIEVIGPYYANRAIESVSCGLQQSAPNRTLVIGWRNRFNNTSYTGMVEYGAVKDAAGNVNDNQNVGWTGDENYYPPDPPLDPPPGGGTGGISGGTDINISAGMLTLDQYYNPDYDIFGTLKAPVVSTDLYWGNTGTVDVSSQLKVVNVDILSVNSGVNIAGGTVTTDIVNGLALLQIPAVTNPDLSSTPTSVVGTVTDSFTTLQVGLAPSSTATGADLSVSWSGANTAITAVPLTLQANIGFSDGRTSTANIDLTIDSGAASYSPQISYGSKWDDWDGGFDTNLV